MGESHLRRTLVLIGTWGLIQTIVTFVLFLHVLFQCHASF